MANRNTNHAYYEEEQGSAVPGQQLHLNRYREAGTPFHLETEMMNFLDPEERSQLQPQVIPKDKRGKLQMHRSYIGLAALTRMQQALLAGGSLPTLKVTLLFGAGNEHYSDLDVAGLRHFLEQVDDRMIINIPGEEFPRFNVGISGLVDPTREISWNQVDRHIDAVGLKGIPYRISTLAAYSTGYGGLNQSINEGLLPLRDVETMVYYDCLYRSDKPPLPAGTAPPKLSAAEQNSGPDEIDGSHAGSAYNTRRAIDAVRTANPKANIVAYTMTSGGSPRYLQGGSDYMVDIPKLIDLRAQAPQSSVTFSEALFALTITRCLDYADKEGQLLANEFPPGFQALRGSLLPRGEIASSLATLNAKSGFSPQTTLIDWGNANAAKVKAAQKDIAAAIGVITDRELMYPGGYPGRANPGGALHAAIMPEFGWEYLV